MENRILNNRYRLEAEIGRGGMGVVYRAIDIQLNRTVAIKVLPPEFVHNTQFLARFNSEIKNTSQLKHENIVSVYDVGVDDNMNYYVMQYVEGEDLKAYLARYGRLTVEETSRILSPIAEALDYAHARGIVHRDIKPENILIDRQGVPSLTDFGIARSMEGTRMTAGMVGTPEYMSPEQAKGEDVCGSSDQYSLAIVAYEMLTSTTPFHSSTAQPWAVVTKHINELPADPRTIVPDLDGHAVDAVMIGLAKKVKGRHSNCIKFVDEMKQKKVEAHIETNANANANANTNTIAKDNVKVYVAGPASTNKPLFIILMVLVGILSLFGAIFLLAGGDKSKPIISGKSNTNPSPTVATPSPPVPLKTNSRDGAEMILIPAGDFLMGSTDTDKFATDAEKPQRNVYLDAYYIYKTEVTVAQYRKFCTATNRAMPKEPDWKWQDTHPIVNVSWNDAKAYAGWAGVSLPTEAQWEKAARGTDERIYPWGNEWDNSKVQCSKVEWGDAGKTALVGSYPAGASPYGVMDMSGNAFEWCRDWYSDDYFYKIVPVQNPNGPAKGVRRVLRGGTWKDWYPGIFRVTCRGNYIPTGRNNGLGFRCALLVSGLQKIKSTIPVNNGTPSLSEDKPSNPPVLDPNPNDSKGPIPIPPGRTIPPKGPILKINPKDGAIMILIPAGKFLMGNTDADKVAYEDEKPQRKVYLDAYYMYKTEVTVAQYRNFCTATNREMPTEPSWKWQDNHPIVNVTWYDAKAYATWAGTSLPTEAQWEKAARGTGGRIYPWGNEWEANKLQWGDDVGQTAPVGSFPAGASPYGMLDMVGNVWEWCSDWYGADYYKNAPSKNPTGPSKGDSRVLRGGAWYNDSDNGGYIGVRGAYRNSYIPNNISGSSVGFRCVSPKL